MTSPATEFVTYLWHYVLARAIYDELLRWHVSRWLIVGAVAAASFVLGRQTRRRT